jgi:hypothetical protein
MRAETSSALHRSESAKRVNVYARRCTQKNLGQRQARGFSVQPLKSLEIKRGLSEFDQFTKHTRARAVRGQRTIQGQLFVWSAVANAFPTFNPFSQSLGFTHWGVIEFFTQEAQEPTVMFYRGVLTFDHT